MKTNLLLFLFVTFFTLQLSAQNPYKEQLNNFIFEERQEKVYLHVDKPQYTIGEDLWFKAYVTDAVLHWPTSVSATLYVELINNEKEVLDSLTLFINNGVGQGDFSLSRDLKSGTYSVRAYTEWMRNNDSNFFYRRDFRIVAPLYSQKVDTLRGEMNVREKLFVDFLPEGGDLINGIPTKVAIRVTNAKGKGATINGTITNNTGFEVATFETNRLGYALCFFQPKKEETYLAIIEKDTFLLPAVESAGAAMRVIHSYNSDNIHITIQSKGIDLKGGTLVMHRRGQFLFSQKCLTTSNMATRLKKADVGVGIIHITFFDKNQTPLSERLIFPNPPVNSSSITMTSDKDAYKKRSKVILNLNAKKDTVHSASITINPQIESSYDNYSENIVNYLLLSSDLKGKIASPNSYFANSEEAYKALDLLMLTHGWSRFNWNSLLKNGFTPTHLPEKGVKIKGKVIDYYSKKSIKEPLIGITVPSIGVINEQFKVSENGTFQITQLQLMDSTVIYMQAYKEKKEKVKKYQDAQIVLESPKRPSITDILYLSNPINPNFIEKANTLEKITKAYFLDNQIIELEGIEITAKSIKEDERDKRTMLYSEPSNRLVLDSIPFSQSAVSIFDLLRQIPGVTITGAFPNQSALIRGITSLSNNSGPAYALDGALVSLETIQTIPVDMVEFIDVLKGPSKAALFGAEGSGGVILVYTRQGGTGKLKEKPTGMLAFTHPGYHKAKEFYSPKYDVENEKHIIPDFRTTLYWNPEIDFENNGAKATFFTSDQEGKFIIRLEGIYTNGQPFFEESHITVE